MSAAGQFEGYASTFGGDPDLQGDVIARGAFAQSLADHKAAGTTPALLWSHDSSEPIGKIVSLEEDDRGLALTGQLAMGVQRADEARTLMQAKALSMSIGFRTRPGGSTYDENGVRV